MSWKDILKNLPHVMTRDMLVDFVQQLETMDYQLEPGIATYLIDSEAAGQPERGGGLFEGMGSLEIRHPNDGQNRNWTWKHQPWSPQPHYVLYEVNNNLEIDNFATIQDVIDFFRKEVEEYMAGQE